MRRIVSLFCVLALAAGACAAQVSQAASVESIANLYDHKQWAEIVRLVPRSPENSPKLDLYRGLALAQLLRFAEAKAALMDGARKAPRDERFPVELGGVAYRMNRLSEAERDLHRALRLNPHDSYALNFLATIYLLRGNLSAALKYWNRMEAPRIAQIQESPAPRLKQALLDRTITVAPLSVMRLGDFETADAELAALGVFPIRRWELQPNQADDYNLVLHSFEENGWGANKWAAALGTLRGLPYATLYPEYRNVAQSAINFDALVRWDSRKRRLFVSASMPLHSDPKWRFEAHADARDERWNLLPSLHAATASGALHLRRIELGAEVRRIESGRWTWNTGASFSRRTLGDRALVPSQVNAFFAGGNVLEWEAGSGYRVLSLPERRLVIDSSASVGLGRAFSSGTSARFERMEGSLRFDWLPRPEGDDYEISSQWRSGAIFGPVPFDDFYTLGVERDDNDLWLRGISATRNGEKGNSPMGRRYLLWNSQWSKVIYHDAFFELKAGPIFDAGEIGDPSAYFGSRGWLWDPGAQITLRVLDTVNVVLSYGHDVRSGENTFFGAALR